MNNNIRIRRGRATDARDIAAIEIASFSDPWSASSIADVLLFPAWTIFVAADENDGVIAYCMLLTAADQGEIGNLAVAKDYQRQGLATRLLEHVFTFAAESHLRAIFLDVRASNVAARALYQSRGFAEIGRRRGYYERPVEDALVLQWSATPAGKTVVE